MTVLGTGVAVATRHKKIQGKIAKRGIFLLPNLFTTGALFAGFYAVVAAIDGNFQRAAIGIFVAMLMDGLDGRIARLTSTSSDFGKEYDSLSDMVSFGLAPALVMYQWGVGRISEYGWIWGKIGWLATFFFAVAAGLRLARFNTSVGGNDRYFVGLPSPSAAGLVGSSIWVGTELALDGLIALAGGLAITVLAGALMISNFQYLSFKKLTLSERIPFAYVVLIPLVFILIAADPPIVLFALFLVYALSGPLVYFWRARQETPVDTAE